MGPARPHRRADEPVVFSPERCRVSRRTSRGWGPGRPRRVPRPCEPQDVAGLGRRRPRRVPKRSDRMRIVTRLVLLVVALALGAPPAGVLAQAYPTRPVEFIIPFAPGGPTDTAIRLIQPQLSASLGAPVVLVNKAGGGGAIGMDAVAKARPDGYTLAATVRSTLTILPATQPDVPYKISDFAIIGSYVVDSQVILVKAGAPWKTLEELVEFAKKNPGKLSYGSAGLGTNSFFTMELLKLTYGLDLTHVPFGGSGPVKNA